MDPYTLLDYALLKLTPTRTRCDLVVVSGEKSEKLASGLVEPFIAHLKFAKDQIPKGGYSIAMRPPSTAASWFTKATFQRFVRFVSTPEILERFMRLEQEISQIESSTDSKSFSKSSSEEGTPPPPGKSKCEVDGADSAAAKENSKYHLQCLLDTRKALLRKEQAMAYARATVAGFEVEQMDDLICFANAFGASRLREACIDFVELYKKKHTDCLWMDEVIAMKACSQPELSYLGNSGVVLACENSNGSLVRSCSLDASSDSKESQPNSDGVGVVDNSLPSTKAQLQMPWPNQIPHYMYNFQSPVQPMPFPGMHPWHMQWAQTVGDSPNGDGKYRHKSSRKKEKVSSSEAPQSSEDGEKTTSSNSDSETDSGEDEKEVNLSRQQRQGRKHKKKSSKTVVIRNINYITSNRRDVEKEGRSDDDSSSSVDATSLDDSSIKQQVDDAISLLEQGHSKKTHKHSKRGSKTHNESNASVENWDAFQNILMSREDEEKQSSPFDGEDSMIQNSSGVAAEKTNTRKHLLSDDSVVVTERYEGHIGNANTVDFANGENIRQSLKSGDDCFIVNNSGNLETQGAKDAIFENGDSLLFDREVNKTATAIDDSFMIQSRSVPDDHQWKTDINMDADFITSATDHVASQTNPSNAEPNDLCVVLARDPTSEVSWKPELDYEIEASFAGLNKSKSSPAIEPSRPSEEASPVKKSIKKHSSSPTTKPPSKLSPGYLSRNKLDPLSKSKKASPTNKLPAQKSKLEREEEARKKMEELVIERQKRIAERTCASSVGSSAAKKVPAKAPSKPEKHRVQPSKDHKLPVRISH